MHLKWINNALKNKEVVMGFGHRVYKSGDSRVPTMREYFGKVAKIKKDKKFEKIYDIVEKVMIKEKNIYPNVDYPTGPTYHLMGFDTDFFTPIFVISRITGWSAHIMEQHAANKLIRPLASYKGSKHRKVMQLITKDNLIFFNFCKSIKLHKIVHCKLFFLTKLIYSLFNSWSV